MQPANNPPAPAIAPPRMSSTVLFAIVAIALVAIAAIIGFIILYGGALTHVLWDIGVASLIFCLLFYMVFAATHNRSIAMPLAAAFFVIGIGSFYGSVFVNDAEQPGGKLLWGVVISIFAIIVLTAVFMMTREGEEDAVRKSQRRITP